MFFNSVGVKKSKKGYISKNFYLIKGESFNLFPKILSKSSILMYARTQPFCESARTLKEIPFLDKFDF